MATTFEDLVDADIPLPENLRAEFYNRMKHTVVTIQSQIHGTEEYMHGGGFFVEDGLILTVFHVIGKKAKNVEFKCYGDEMYNEAKVVYTDSSKDLALLCCTKAKDDVSSTPMKYVKFCPTEQMRVGLPVISISHPSIILVYSCTFGEVAYPADELKSGRKMGVCRTREDKGLLEFQADLDVVQVNNVHGIHGSSGCPIFNGSGLVVGMTIFVKGGFDFIVHSGTLGKFIAKGKGTMKPPKGGLPMTVKRRKIDNKGKGGARLISLIKEEKGEKVTVVGENEKAVHCRGGKKQQSVGSCFSKRYSENVVPRFSFPAVSGVSSAKETPLQIKYGLSALHHEKADPARELEDTAVSIDRSYSENLCSVCSCKAGCWRRTSTQEPRNYKVERNQSEAAHRSTVPRELITSHHDPNNVCAANCLKHNACQSKCSGHKHKSYSESPSSPLHRKTIQNAATEAENQMSRDKSSANDTFVISSREELVKSVRSSLPGQATVTSTINNVYRTPFSATATTKGLQCTSIERIPKSNIKTSTITTQKETKPVTILQRRLEVSRDTVSKPSNCAMRKKYASSSPSLKSMILEESKTDLESSNPLKSAMESTKRGGLLQVSPTVNKKLEVAATINEKLELSPKVNNNMVLGTGNPGAYQDNVSMDTSAYSNRENVADLEIPVLIENVEETEVCARELDNICSMLRKKNEEAKELLVGSVINNMLSHPMYDEKICTLQKTFMSFPGNSEHCLVSSVLEPTLDGISS